MLQNRGVTLLNENKFEEAKVVAQESIELREKLMGADSLWAATAYQLLGQVYPPFSLPAAPSSGPHSPPQTSSNELCRYLLRN